MFKSPFAKHFLEDKTELTSSQCSCTQCDSTDCFAIRHKTTEKQCSCRKCDDINACLLPHNEKFNLNYGLTNILNPKNINTSNDKAKTEITVNCKDGAERGFNVGGNFIKEQIENEIFYNDDYSENIRKSSKKGSHKSISIHKDKTESFYNDINNEILSKYVHNTAVTYSCSEPTCGNKEFNSTAKLSAQVMNLPYSDFKDSFNRTNKSFNTYDKLSIYDIFKRIKEVYQACNCKVCECITGKSLSTKIDSCKCQPCECKDCMTFMTKLKFGKYCTEEIDSQGCRCKPCECITCIRGGWNAPCSCKPCDCMDCKSLSLARRNTVIVASVEEERPACQCSPCECAQCGGQGIPFATNLMHEMSTSINRHPHCRCETCLNEACEPDGNDSCRCERRDGVMRKPVNRNTQDYDIRTAILSNNKNKKFKTSKFDALAMFAAISTTYPINSIQKNKQDCKCNDCECILCERNSAMPSYLQYAEDTLQTSNSADLNKDGCACSSCECQIYKCRNHRINNFETQKRCNCNICDCIECDKFINVESSCAKLIVSNQQYSNDTLSTDSVYPIKKGKLLTPDMFNNSSLCRELSVTLSSRETTSNMSESNPAERFAENLFVDRETNCKKESQNVSIYHVHPENDYFDKLNLLHITPSSSLIELSRNNGIHEIANINELQQKKQGRIDKYHECTENKNINLMMKSKAKKNTECQISINKTPPKISCVTLNNNITPSSSKRYTPKSLTSSWQSSCNSSGYDDSEYLIQFPSNHVENRLKGEPNLDSNIKIVAAIPESDLVPMLNKNDIDTLQLNNNLKRPYDKGEFSEAFDNRFKTSDCQGSTSISVPCESYPSANGKYKKESNVFKVTNYQVNQKLKSTIFPSTAFESYPEVCVSKTHPKLSKNYDADEDYKRAQNTLREARAFSIELMGILEKYEKANREFKSVAAVLTINKQNLDNDDVNSSPLKFDNHYEPYTLNQEKSIINLLCTQPEECMKQSEENVSLCDNKDRNNDNINAKKSSYLILSEYMQELQHEPNCITNMQNGIIRGSSEVENLETNVINKPSVTSVTNQNKEVLNNNADKPNINKKYIKLIKHASTYKRTAKNKALKASAGKLKNSLINTDRDRSSIEMKNSKFSQNSNKITVSSKHVVAASTSGGVIDIPDKVQILEKKSLEVLKKNIYLNDKYYGKSRDFTLFPLLASEINNNQLFKKKAECMHESRYENKALVTVQIMVQDLLNMPQLQPLYIKTSEMKESMNESINSHSKNKLSLMFNETAASSTPLQPITVLKNLDIIPHVKEHSPYAETHQEMRDLLNSMVFRLTEEKNVITTNDSATMCDIEELNKDNSKSSCDALRVGSLGVRRVSDHTVLVKWKSPLDVTNVQGYELLVDGRAIQKMLSPSRSMAVVTCLPHSHSIVITIRTLTTPASHATHYPATTTVYRPRVK